MAALFVLPSPFLGPPPYERLVAALRDRGAPAGVATYDEPPVASELVERWAYQATTHDDVVLVAHSNAGSLAPSVSERLGGAAIVFLDAALPTNRITGPAPAAFREFLAGLADANGLLPRWTRWWPRGEYDALPGDWFDLLDAQLPRVPLAYVDSEVAVPEGWQHGRCAYVGFGAETYAEELSRARDLGWPVRVLGDAGHLHCVVEPAATADALVAFLARPGW